MLVLPNLGRFGAIHADAGGEPSTGVERSNDRAIYEPPMQKGEETRAAILQAGLCAASLDGFEALTIGKLAKHVGMSKSGLFAHFSAKEGLQLAVLEHAAARFIEIVVGPAFAHPRGEPRLRALFDNWLAWRERAGVPGGCVFLAGGLEFDDKPGLIRDFLVKSQRDWIDTLAGAVAIGQREGHFDSAFEPEQIAFELYGLMIGSHFFSRLMADPAAENRARSGFEALLTRIRAKRS
jgi:AcrR family transcriptional regulator